MKFFQQVNGWVIKEKTPGEVPLGIDIDRRYAVFAPGGPPLHGRFLEDNLTFLEAIGFCVENPDIEVYRRKLND